MISIIVLSKKRKINQLPKIKKDEFIINNFKSKLEAKDNKLIDKIISDEDPSEIRIAINEMAFHIYNKNTIKSLYWLSWIVARLGGWNCYYKPPGPKTMRDGWLHFAAIAQGYNLAYKNV